MGIGNKLDRLLSIVIIPLMITARSLLAAFFLSLPLLGLQGCNLTARTWERDWIEDRRETNYYQIERAAVETEPRLRLLLSVSAEEQQASSQTLVLRPRGLPPVPVEGNAFDVEHVAVHELTLDKRGREKRLGIW